MRSTGRCLQVSRTKALASVPAEGGLGTGCKPSEIETIAGLDEKGGLGRIVFRGDGLQALVVNPLVENGTAPGLPEKTSEVTVSTW